jgi:DNA-binding response OmpR family regulator
LIGERGGFNALTAGDGRAAVELFRRHADDVVCVLMDLTMPHLDGQQAFTEMRRIRPNVRVILSSGYNEEDATDRFAGKGLAGFVQKPYDGRTLLAEITRVLRRGDER